MPFNNSIYRYYREKYPLEAHQGPFSPSNEGVQQEVLHSIFSPTHDEKPKKNSNVWEQPRPHPPPPPPAREPPPPPPPPRHGIKAPPPPTGHNPLTPSKQQTYTDECNKENVLSASPSLGGVSRFSYISEILLSPTGTGLGDISSLDVSMDLFFSPASSKKFPQFTLEDIQNSQSLSELIRMQTVLKRQGQCESLLRAVDERLGILRGFCSPMSTIANGTLSSSLETIPEAPDFIQPEAPVPNNTRNSRSHVNDTKDSSLVMSLSTDDEEEVEDSMYMNPNQLASCLRYAQELNNSTRVALDPNVMYRDLVQNAVPSPEVAKLKFSLEYLEQQNQLLRDQIFQQTTTVQDLELAQAECKHLEREQYELKRHLAMAESDLKSSNADKEAAVQCLLSIVSSRAFVRSKRLSGQELRRLLTDATAQVAKSKAEIASLSKSFLASRKQCSDAVKAKTKSEGLLVAVTKRIRTLEKENLKLIAEIERLTSEMDTLKTQHCRQLSEMEHKHSKTIKTMKMQLVQSENLVPLRMFRPSQQSFVSPAVNSFVRTDPTKKQVPRYGSKRQNHAEQIATKSTATAVPSNPSQSAQPVATQVDGNSKTTPVLLQQRIASKPELGARNTFRKRVTFADLNSDNTKSKTMMVFDKENASSNVALMNKSTRSFADRKLAPVVTFDESPALGRKPSSYLTPTSGGRPRSAKSKTPSRIEFSFSPKTPKHLSQIRISKVRAAGGRLALQEKVRKMRSPATKFHQPLEKLHSRRPLRQRD